jgi:tRNA-binding protein
MITYQQFSDVKIIAGTIIKAETFPKAKNPSYKVWVDFGSEIGVLQTSAQITVNYTPEQLINTQILGCINLGEKNIAGFISQFLLLGLTDKNGAIVLARPEKFVPNGSNLH